MRNFLLFFAACFLSVQVFSQTDNTFWFAAPDVSSVHGPYNPDNGRPINLHITAQYATHVTISRPADAGFTPVEYDLAEMEHITIRMDNANGTGLFDFDEIENYPSPDLVAGVQVNGFLIESYPGEITAYYELDNINNRDIFPLKGKNALGREFWVSTQNRWQNGTDYGGTAWSGFVICATEDNTTVTVYQNDNWLYFAGPAVRTVTLNAGETFVFRAASTNANRHINGVRVTSTKNIVITIYDDSVHKQPWGCKDIIGDQIVPVSLIGHEYIVMKGYLYGEERIFITGTAPGTVINVGGSSPSTFTIGAGQVQSVEMFDRATHVIASKPVYINHLTGFGCEMGGALLPTIDGCTGSNTVTFTRTPTTSDQFFLNIMVRNDTVDGSMAENQSIFNFTLTVNGVVHTVPETFFEFIEDSAFAVLRDDPVVHQFFANLIQPGYEAQVNNPIARFHLGIINGGPGDGCKYGYFSDYAANTASAGLGGATAETQDVYCNMDPILLVAAGGTAYDWTGVSSPNLSQYLNDSTVAAPYFYPPDTGEYMFKVKILGECSHDTTIYIRTIVKYGPTSDFMISDMEGCSPFSTTITNTTVGNPKIMKWQMGTLGNVVDQDTLTNPFVWNFPPNTSNSVVNYMVRLTSYQDEFFSCLSMREKTVKIYPEVNSGFSITDTLDCHPLITDFVNESSGHLDSTSYMWDFGDNSQSFEENPVHSYSNFGLEDTTYTVRLVTESPFGCLDSAFHNLTVHPRVRTAMAINTSASCSPLDIVIDPTNSLGVDTFFWHVHSPTADSVYITTLNAPVGLYHQDITYAGPDTIYVNLIGMNRMGCTDTFPERNIVVFPEVNSIFEIDEDTICDADTINFVNNSLGFDLFYTWDFDDGTVFQDTTGTNFPHAFFNRSPVDSSYRVTLTATSGYFCESIFDTVIVVHPFIQANFGMDFANNCTPITANFSNLSIGGDSFEWDFGNDSTSTTAIPTFSIHYWNENDLTDTTYYVRLIARNNEGCSDSLERTIDVLPHVVAAFGLSDSIGCSPLAVHFTNSSTGGLLSYLWNFGNGSSSTNPSPPDRSYTNYHDYDTSYIVSLTAVNPYGCDSVVTDTVSVFAYIDADFNLPQADSCSPFLLRPVNLSSPGAHFFEWDLLNSGFMTDYDPVPDFGILTNTSTLTDTLYLRLIAYGANDPEHLACADRDSMMVMVHPKLDVDFSVDLHESCQPLITSITNGTNITSGSYFEWYIDSTFYSATANPPQLTLPNLGSADIEHVIILTGESNFGCAGEHRDTVTVYSLVDARFTINRSGICSADSFEIDRRTSRGGIVTYQWDFDGTTDNRPDDVFPYSFENTASATPLTRPITLRVLNSHGCESSITRSISVYPEVRADFTMDDYTVCYPWATNFVNTTENADNFYWDFGDGTGSNDLDPVNHIFGNFNQINDANYTVRLITRSDYNCYDSAQQSITVYAKPNAEFYFPVMVDCPPFVAQMINESDGYNLTYFWQFGDGYTSTGQSPSHLFENNTSSIAEVPVRLIVTSGRTCKDTVDQTLSIYPNVTVSFTPSEYEGCSPLTVNLNGTAPFVNSRLWYIDGVPFSELEDPTREFVNNTPTTREYEVRFEGRSLYGCTDDTTQIITVYSTPTAEFIPSPLNQSYNTAEDRTLVTFMNETYFQPSWEYEWDFGDGNTGNNGDAVFDYYYGELFWGLNSNGNRIPVTLRAWNTDRSECEDIVSYDITIKPPLPEIALEENTAGCVPFAVDFSATVRYADEDSYEWDFGSDAAVSSEHETMYTYGSPGTYTVLLVVTGEGGSNWDSRIITVYPKPNIDFTFNDSAVFVRNQNRPDEVINFYNQTTLGENYWWFFELTDYDQAAMAPYMDLAAANSTDPAPTWYYGETGLYYVGLIAESPHSCMDTLIHRIPINVLGEGRILFPNAFMVNPIGSAPDDYVDNPEDPRRNIFRAYGQGVDKFKLEVYNRWGVLVFETDDINYGWNGFIDGKPAKQDVYIWRAKGSFTNGEPFQQSGDVTLIHTMDPTQVND